MSAQLTSLPIAASSRPAVSLIVPFAGSPGAAVTLLGRLAAVRRTEGDEVIVVDNGPPGAFDAVPPGVTVIRADDHPSSYYARNVGAAEAHGEWLLFVDADCEPHPDILDRYFEPAPLPDCGAVGGAIRDAPEQPGLAARYTRVRGLLNQAHNTSLGRWAFVLTANMLVRREAYEAIGGFCERIRSTGDADFSWRMRATGWSIAYNDRASVVHHHRETVGGLARQAARYAAGATWIRRRHGEPEYIEEANARTVAKGVRNVARAAVSLNADGVRFRLIDALLLGVRRVALHLPNVAAPPVPRPAPVTLLAGRFPAEQAQLELARGAHVEAQGRPLGCVHAAATRGVDVAYREDDGDTIRWRDAATLLVRHPRRTGRWLAARRGRAPLGSLFELAPVASRIAASGAERLRPLDDEGARLVADVVPLAGLQSRNRS